MNQGSATKLYPNQGSGSHCIKIINFNIHWFLSRYISAAHGSAVVSRKAFMPPFDLQGDRAVSLTEYRFNLKEKLTNYDYSDL